MIDNNFTADRYSALLGNLRDNGYLSQNEVDILQKNALTKESGYFESINDEKAEIVRIAILENRKRKFK